MMVSDHFTETFAASQVEKSIQGKMSATPKKSMSHQGLEIRSVTDHVGDGGASIDWLHQLEL